MYQIDFPVIKHYFQLSLSKINTKRPVGRRTLSGFFKKLFKCFAAAHIHSYSDLCVSLFLTSSDIFIEGNGIPKQYHDVFVDFCDFCYLVTFISSSASFVDLSISFDELFLIIHQIFTNSFQSTILSHLYLNVYQCPLAPHLFFHYFFPIISSSVLYQSSLPIIQSHCNMTLPISDSHLETSAYSHVSYNEGKLRFPYGTLSEIAGPSASGKTQLCCDIVADFLSNSSYSNQSVVYITTEA